VRLLPERNAARPGDDPIFALNRAANARKASGDRVINATVGAMLEDDGSLAVLPSVITALREVPPQRVAGYAPIGGHPDFLAAVTADLLGGTTLAAQTTAVATPGGSGALCAAVATFLDAGQALVTSSFYWGPYSTICQEHERTLRTFAMFDERGGFNVAALDRTLAEVGSAQGRLLVFLNDPCHNPTGYSMTDGEWRDTAAVLAAAAARVPTVVLADMAYLAFARTRSRTFLDHLAPLAERALVLFAWSASKAFTSYGLRVGALLACTADPTLRAAVGAALTFACRGTWSNCNASGMAAVTACLTDAALRARVDGERDRLREILGARVAAWNRAADAARLSYPRYDGGFFVTVFAPDATGAAARLQEKGIFVVPQPGALRVALCGVAERDIPDLVHGMQAAIG
jgi:aromatic-amino-acid transaminase